MHALSKEQHAKNVFFGNHMVISLLNSGRDVRLRPVFSECGWSW
jgi:hypothetical protein